MRRAIEAIVVGGSAGALDALAVILPELPRDYPIPIAVVIHVRPDGSSRLTDVVAWRCPLAVKEAEDKETLAPATVYLAPANYHLLVEKTGCFSLSVDEVVLHSRPAIDVLFESAADAYRSRLLGILLTGANQDGAQGLAAIQKAGGATLVQSPETAPARTMPEAALRLFKPDQVLPLAEIGPYLVRIGHHRPTTAETG